MPRRLRALAGRAGPASLALILTLIVLGLGLRGTDAAAQAYRIEVVRLHGLVVWDSGWYGGNYPLSYSVLFPAFGALVGLTAASVASAVVATWCFDRVVHELVGRRALGSWYFAVSTILAVTIGQLTYLSGEAVAIAAVLALVQRRPRVGVALGMLSALFSPLAAAFLVLACAVWAVQRGEHRRSMLATAGATAAVVLAIAVLFPGDGSFPFRWSGLVVVELLCALVISPVVRTSAVVRLAAAVYGLATLASFLVANPLGGNATRLAESVGVPLVACLLTVRRDGRVSRRVPAVGRPALAAVLLVPFAVWQWAPDSHVVASASGTPSDTSAFYRPLLAQLTARDGSEPVRVEVVPTLDHWESAYVGPYVPLARGWERQLDVADNPLFYVPGALGPASYRAWLTDNGVTWVALPRAPLDYAGTAEAALLGSGRVPGLQLAWRTADWQLWRVVDSPGLVSGPARLTAMGPDRLAFAVERPGDFVVRVHYISYWHLSAGRACVQPAPGGWTEVHASSAGTVELDAELVGSGGASCPTS